MKRPTIRDVSDAAQVSTYTVSIALRSGEGVSPETREHVRRVARELGYVPNVFARGLRGGRTRSIGILASNTRNPFYSTLITHAEQVLRESGFHGLVMDAVVDGVYRVDREDDFVDDLLRQQVGGAILTYGVQLRNLDRLQAAGVRVVLADTDGPAGATDVARVSTDNELGGRLLGEHLAFHRIPGPWTYVAFPESYSSRAGRQRGFLDAAAAAGVTVDVVEAGNDDASARVAVATYLDARGPGHGLPLPGAIFATNELLLHGVLTALRQRSLRVPDQIAVVAYDEFLWSALVDPSMTVVDQHVGEVGEQAARLLLGQLSSDGTPQTPAADDVVVLPHLIVRRSCGCTPSREGKDPPWST